MVKTLFIGTSDFAVPILDKLIKSNKVDLTVVVTQPDRPAGRKQTLTPPDVKKYLIENDIDVPIYQPEKLSLDAAKILDVTKPEIIIVASYGQFIPKLMLDYPKYKCLNIHASLLPDLRGAVPMPMAILKGYKKTGVTIQVMSEGMDEGDIVAQDSIDIEKDETTQSLTQKLSNISADLVINIFDDWINGVIKPTPQDDSKATYCYQRDISKENAEIDWSKHAKDIERMIRAFNPWPVAWFTLSDVNISNKNVIGKRVKVFEADVVDYANLIGTNEATRNIFRNLKTGQIFKHNKELFVKTGDQGNIGLRIKELQIEGKPRSDYKSYLYLVS